MKRIWLHSVVCALQAPSQPTSSVNYEVQITPFSPINEENVFSQPDLPASFCSYSMNLFPNTFVLSWKRLMWVISFTEMIFNG